MLKASDILADVAFSAGLDVKKSELHGMSQRGGSVSSDVRFGAARLQSHGAGGRGGFPGGDRAGPGPGERMRRCAQGGMLIEPSQIDESSLPNKKSINVALLGVLSRHLPFSIEAWTAALQRNLPEKLHEANLQAFSMGRTIGQAAGQEG